MVNPPPGDPATDLSPPVTSVVLPLPLRECWPYLREPELVREWHGWEYDGLDAEIEEIFGGARLSEDHRTIGLGTHLFNLFEEDETTRVDVHRLPLPPDDEWARYLPDIDEGWTSFLQQLRFKLDRHRDDRRQTMSFAGAPKDPTIAPVQWLGLGQLALQEVGAPYGATVGPGDALTGTLWFVSQNQVGLTVDDWGDGLLVAGNGPAGGPPYTGSQVILTTYGLDERRREEMAGRWTAWWGRHFEQPPG